MLRISITRPLVAVGLACAVYAPSVEAQLQVVHENRFEITPFGGYQWGGSFDTDPGTLLGAGQLEISDAFGYGAILSFLAGHGSSVELTYLRQDANIEFKPATTAAKSTLGGFAVNYLQIGGLYEFNYDRQFRPFINGSLGIGIFDPKTEGIGSETRFSWSVGTGAKYMFNSGRIGLRGDLRLWITPVPSGDYGTWCDFYGCFVVEGTAWVTQGTASGGIIFAF